MTPHAVVTLLARTLPDHGEADVTSLGGGLNAVLFKASTPAGPLSVKIPRRHLSPRQAHAVVQAEMRNLRTVQGSGMTPQLVAEIPPASPCPGGGLVMTWIDGVPLDRWCAPGLRSSIPDFSPKNSVESDYLYVNKRL